MWESEIVQGVVIALISSFLTYVGWLKSKEVSSKTLFDDMGSRVYTIEQKYLTEARIRELINEETSDLRHGINALNKDIRDLSELIGNLRIDLAVLNYIKGTKPNTD